MRSLISTLFVLACLVLSACGMAEAVDALGYVGNLANSSTVTTTTTGTTYLFEYESGKHRAQASCAFMQYADHTSGTSPTLDGTIEHSYDGTNFAGTAVTSFTQVTTTDTIEQKVPSAVWGPYVRSKATLGGTSPSYATWRVDLACDQPFTLTAQ